MRVRENLSMVRRGATRACPVLGCTRKRTAGQLMCNDCFNQAPTPLRALYWNARTHNPNSDELRELESQMIASVPPTPAEVKPRGAR